MTSLEPATRAVIKDYLLREGARYIREAAARPDQTPLKPFHARLMPVPFAAWSRWSERSFSTRSGGWFQHIAVVVARQYHPRAESNYAVEGEIRNAAEAHIGEMLALMNQNRRTPSRPQDLAEMLAVQGPGGTPRTAVSDLFIERADGGEMYFEIKTPSPNKGQCMEMKERMLLITALRHGHAVEARAATAYNPFGEAADYAARCDRWVRQFLDIGRDFLIGRSFWSEIGDADTYGDLLAVSEEVGDELTPLFERYALGPDADA